MFSENYILSINPEKVSLPSRGCRQNNLGRSSLPECYFLERSLFPGRPALLPRLVQLILPDPLGFKRSLLKEDIKEKSQEKLLPPAPASVSWPCVLLPKLAPLMRWSASSLNDSQHGQRIKCQNVT